MDNNSKDDSNLTEFKRLSESQFLKHLVDDLKKEFSEERDDSKKNTTKSKVLLYVT